MIKFVQISTAVSAIQIRSQLNPNGGVTLVQRTVAVDEHGAAWELVTDGMSAEWKKLPALPELPAEPARVN